MEVALTFIAFFASVFGIFYFYFATRNRERLSLIEKGANSSLFFAAKTKEPRGRVTNLRFSLKAGSLIVGTGIGFILSYVLYLSADKVKSEDGLFALMVVGIVFVCGGFGLITGYYLGRKLDKADFKE
jgi:Kef-type K+ transport system membrane component KefB